MLHNIKLILKGNKINIFQKRRQHIEVVTAKTNKGTADSPSNHLQPKFVTTAKASATWKHAFTVQNYYWDEKKT